MILDAVMRLGQQEFLALQIDDRPALRWRVTPPGKPAGWQL
jgi:hypothetical protein